MVGLKCCVSDIFTPLHTGGSKPMMKSALTDSYHHTEIHQYFGSSTPDGIGFQFRAIKQGANALKNAVEKGEDPIAAFSDHISGSGSASVPATPTRRAAGSVKRGRAATKTPASRATPASKRRKATVIKPESGFDDTDLPEVDYDELDQSPTRDVAKVKRTPRKNPALLPRSAWAKPDPAAGIMPLKSSFARAQEAQASRAASATSAPSPAATIPHPGMNYFPFTAAGAANSTSAPAPPLTVTPNNANANGKHDHHHHHHHQHNNNDAPGLAMLTTHCTGTVASMTGASHSSIDMTHSSSPPANNNHHNIGSAANARPPSAPGASSTTLIGKPTTMTMSAALGSFAEAEFASYNVSTTDPVGFTDEEKELFSDHVNFDHAWEDDIGDC